MFKMPLFDELETSVRAELVEACPEQGRETLRQAQGERFMPTMFSWLPTALAAALLAAGLASAQTPQAAPPVMTAPDKPVFAIRGFDVTGENPLSATESRT